MAEAVIESLSNDQVIEGGEITGVGEGKDEIRVDPLKKERAQTTKMLAYVLVGILALSFVLHYAAMTFLLFSNRMDGVEALNTIFTTWLPVISGLASSAVTYYFTREK